MLVVFPLFLDATQSGLSFHHGIDTSGRLISEDFRHIFRRDQNPHGELRTMVCSCVFPPVVKPWSSSERGTPLWELSFPHLCTPVGPQALDCLQEVFQEPWIGVWCGFITGNADGEEDAEESSSTPKSPSSSNSSVPQAASPPRRSSDGHMAFSQSRTAASYVEAHPGCPGCPGPDSNSVFISVLSVLLCSPFPRIAIMQTVSVSSRHCPRFCWSTFSRLLVSALSWVPALSVCHPSFPFLGCHWKHRSQILSSASNVFIQDANAEVLFAIKWLLSSANGFFLVHKVWCTVFAAAGIPLFWVSKCCSVMCACRSPGWDCFAFVCQAQAIGKFGEFGMCIVDGTDAGGEVRVDPFRGMHCPYMRADGYSWGLGESLQHFYPESKLLPRNQGQHILTQRYVGSLGTGWFLSMEGENKCHVLFFWDYRSSTPREGHHDSLEVLESSNRRLLARFL